MKTQMQHRFKICGSEPPICYNLDATIGNKQTPKGWHQDIIGWIQKQYDLYLCPSIKDKENVGSDEVPNTNQEYYRRPELEHWDANVINFEESPVMRSPLVFWTTI